MLVHDDMVHQILLWLPVISLLRFKLVCRTWRALISSYHFIEQHLHHHHHDPNLKDKNHYLLVGKDSPFTFSLISTDSYEGSNTCVQQDCSDLHEYFPLTMDDIVSYNGIICLNLINRKGELSICLCNPATKQLRILPQSHALGLETEHNPLRTAVGFGFDIETNDYKVVNICINNKSVEVYSLSTDSWRSVTTIIPFQGCWRNPRVPFNNGTYFFWYTSDIESGTILCFNFSSEKFHSVSFPNASDCCFNRNAIVLSDKIGCVFNTFDYETEIWVFDGYGSANESWVKLYTIDPFPAIERGMSVTWLSMIGNHLFFRAIGHMDRLDDVITRMVCGYNLVTEELKNLFTVEISVEIRKEPSVNLLRNCLSTRPLVEYKESLVSVGKTK